MFPPMTPMTERTRIQNENREIERRAAMNARMLTQRLNLWAVTRRGLSGLRVRLAALKRIELPRLRGTGQAKSAGKS